MKRVLAFFILSVHLFGATSYALESASSTQIKDILSPEERVWLKNHPTIRFAFPPNLPPYSKINDQGKPEGFIHEWFAMLNEVAGSNMVIVPHPVQNLYSDFGKGAYDGIAGVTYSTLVPDDYIYTDEIVAGRWSVYTSRSAIAYSQFSQVSTESIGILKGSMIESILRKLYPDIKLVSYPTFLAALLAIEKKEVFAVLGESRILSEVVKREKIYSIFENFVAKDLKVSTGSQIRKDWPTLARIINKAQDSISNKKRNQLLRKWLSPDVNLSHLTLDEIQWLMDNQSFDINFYELAPYLVSNGGKKDGFLVDYFSLFEEMLGLKINLKIVPFKQFPLNRDAGLPDASLTLSKEEYQDKFEFTTPFFYSSFALFTRIDHPRITNLEQLENHTIGLIKGAQPEQFKKHLIKHPGTSIKTYPDTSTMVDDLLLEEIDSIYAEASVMRSYLSSNMVQSVWLNWLDTKNIIGQSVAIRKDLAPLADILSKSFSKIDKQSQSRVFQKWLVVENALGSAVTMPDEFDSKTSYSTIERDWIGSHPTVFYSDVSWVPYVKVDDSGGVDAVSGIGKDYLDLISKDSGITFTYIPSSSWPQLIDKLKNNEISMSIAAGITPEREAFAIFSDPYITSSMSIVTSDKYAYVQDLEQLEGLTVSIPEGLYLTDYVKEYYPGIKLVYTDTIEQALELVAQNKTDAFIGSMAVVASHLRSAELYNLRVSGLINRQLDIHFMIGNTHPILLSIINKSLARIKDTERREIANRWFSVNYQSGIRSETVWFILLTASVILAITFYWIRRLRQEISEKNRVQKALKSARVDAELANKAKSEFLANMSHEIRTPMNAIVGFSHLLSESELTDKQQAYLRSIRVGSDGLLHIINDILDLSKIEAGKMQIECVATDLGKMIEELDLLFYSGMKEKGIDFCIEIEESVPRYLLIDANRVRQILLNIIGNAQKFTDFGKVDLKVYRQISVEAPDKIDLFIDVIDTGIGIDKPALESIFQHFEQNSQGSTSQYAGTGLGLAISRKLAEKMNGSLSAVSALGRGSCFTLRLNSVSLSEQVATVLSEKRTYEFDDSVVLIVDDVESNRILLTKYLENYPFELFIAENGLEAVEMAERTRPNLVLMDLRMPELDGYEATKRIKKHRDTIVIALTASALEDEESKKKQQVFDDFLRKPILKSKLISTMAKFLSHQTQLENEQQPVSWDISTEHQTEIASFINDEIMANLKNAHKMGDVEEIEQLSNTLRDKSVVQKHSGLQKYADELIIACKAFDVERIDYLIILFIRELT